ncbi:MAG: HAD family phosphatase [Chloroflexi bacterium]|nr:HAD family phosphatase [Chloroflexota bacterium]
MKAVIFDLGRVLVHYNHAQTLAALSTYTTNHGAKLIEPNSEMIKQLGRGKINGRSFYQFLVLQAEFTANYDTFVTTFTSTLARNETALDFALNLNARPDITVGIISNTNQVHATWLHKQIPELKQFDSLILSNEVGLQKPDPAIFELSLRELGVTAVNAIFIDDIAENIAGAVAIGMHGVQHVTLPATRTAIENWLQVTPSYEGVSMT